MWAAVQALASFLGGLASSLVLPLFAWIAGRRKERVKQQEKTLDAVARAKAVRSRLDRLDDDAIRDLGHKWVRDGAADKSD